MDKRADMVSTMVVGFIILLVGFFILVIFFGNLWNQGQTDKEVCHQSVIARATLPEAVNSLVSLNCKASNICITSGLFGGSCDFAKGESVEKIKVSNVDQIQKAIAGEIVDCWSMMGEGKLSLFSQYLAKTYGLGTIYSSCVICSKIKFDTKSLTESKLIPEVIKENMDLYAYMASHKIPNGDVSYLEYLTGNDKPAQIGFDTISKTISPLCQDANGNKYPCTSNTEATNQKKTPTKVEGTKVSKDPSDLDINAETDEIAILFMQVSAPSHGGSLLNIGKTALGVGIGAGFISRGMTWGIVNEVGKLVLSNPLTSLIIATVGVGAQQGMVAYDRAIAAGKCNDVVINGGNPGDGCSVVRVVKYDMKSISQYCQRIDSIP